MTDVVIVSAVRTAIGAFGGTLRESHAAAIASVAMKAAVERAGIDAALIDDVRFGCCLEPDDAMNVARIGALMAGIPETVTAVTINRVCISGMEAIISGMAMIQAGMADVILAGGVEHMSGAPYTVPKARWGCRLQDQTLVDSIMCRLHSGSQLLPLDDSAPFDTRQPPVSLFLGKPYLMGHTAEFLAQHLQIDRAEMDEVALRSHNEAERATADGSFRDEIVPMPLSRRKGPDVIFDRDEHFRPGLTLQDLQALPPVFLPRNGTVTAGNASGINDGAAALVIMSAQRAKALGISPMAKIQAVGRGGCHPARMGLSPVPAVNELTKRSGLKVPDFELVELNEAFAAQYIACERQLGLNRAITNVNGSGIGLGHPVGATGARIVVTLLHAMKHRGKGLGLATLCGGGGVAMACALEML
jgi:acetyl-CoA C-acetyltransferase